MLQLDEDMKSFRKVPCSPGLPFFGGGKGCLASEAVRLSYLALLLRVLGGISGIVLLGGGFLEPQPAARRRAFCGLGFWPGWQGLKIRLAAHF